MIASTENINRNIASIKGEQVIQEYEVNDWFKFPTQLLKRIIQIAQTPDNLIIYSKDGEILRKEQIIDPQNHDLFVNMDQIKFLQWQGEYRQNNKKFGKWTAFWNGESLLQVGGYYTNGLKQGLWKNPYHNFSNKVLVFEIGQYFNNLKIGRWKYVYKNNKIGGGSYNNQGQKIGKWSDLSESFWDLSQVIYNGEYNGESNKVGLWNILYNKSVDQSFQQIAGGLYDGGSLKIGNWIDLVIVTFSGDYNNINGKKVGYWEAIFTRNNYESFEWIGGGSYDQDSIKIVNWIEISDRFNDFSQVTYNGEYNEKGKKIGKWDIVVWAEEIGGGVYSERESLKFGSWIELSDEFTDYSQIVYNGVYNKNGKKVDRWDIMYRKKGEKKFEKIGGGSQDQQGFSNKIGKWIEINDGFWRDSQVTYVGAYNQNGKKVGKWDIYFQQRGLIGGGQYDQEGGLNKNGRWIEINDGFWRDSQLTYSGAYNENGKKVGRWDIYFYHWKHQNQLIGGGSYHEALKIGRWIEPNDGFYNLSQITYNGVYNRNGKKIGRWDIYLNQKLLNEQIGGGYYDEDGSQIKIGNWIQLSDRFYDDAQVIYRGLYNGGKKIGRWDIDYRNGKGNVPFSQIGGGSYDERDSFKIGKWIELEENFGELWGYHMYIGEYNSKGQKDGTWVKARKKQNDELQIKEIKY